MDTWIFRGKCESSTNGHLIVQNSSSHDENGNKNDFSGKHMLDIGRKSFNGVASQLHPGESSSGCIAVDEYDISWHKYISTIFENLKLLVKFLSSFPWIFKIRVGLITHTSTFEIFSEKYDYNFIKTILLNK